MREYPASKRNNMMLRGVGEKGVNWMQGGATQREMEFLAGLTMNKQDIYDRLAPGLFSAMQTSALTNGENGLVLFLRTVIAPLLRETTDKINAELISVYGENQEAEYEDVVPEDKVLKMAEIEQFSKFHTVDEVRVVMFNNKPDSNSERGALFVSQVKADTGNPEPIQPVDAVPNVIEQPIPEQPVEDVQPEDAETKADLSRWKRKAIKNVGTVKAGEFTSDFIPAEMAITLRDKIITCKTADDVALVFADARAVKPVYDDSAIKALAWQIEQAVAAATQPEAKGQEMNTIIIDTQGNAIKAQSNDSALILEAIKALVTQQATKAEIVIPAPLVTVIMPEQPAPIVNFSIPETVVNVSPAVNNITVQPANLSLPAMPTEAEIVTMKDGTRKLKVK